MVLMFDIFTSFPGSLENPQLTAIRMTKTILINWSNIGLHQGQPRQLVAWIFIAKEWKTLWHRINYSTLNHMPSFSKILKTCPFTIKLSSAYLGIAVLAVFILESVYGAINPLDCAYVWIFYRRMCLWTRHI